MLDLVSRLAYFKALQILHYLMLNKFFQAITSFPVTIPLYNNNNNNNKETLREKQNLF